MGIWYWWGFHEVSIDVDAAVPAWGGSEDSRKQTALIARDTRAASGPVVPRQSALGHGVASAGATLPGQRAPEVERVPSGPRTTAGSAPVVAPASERGFSAWLRRWGLHVELAVALVMGLAFIVSSSTPVVALVTFGVWVVGAFYRGRAVTTPLRHQLRVVASSALLPLALLSMSVAALSLPVDSVRQGVLAVTSAAAVTALSRSLRWTLQAPVRVVAVGDRASVATAVARLPRTSRCRVVGVVVVEEGLADDAVPHQILGVPCHRDLDAIADVVTAHAADLVVVDPGRAVSADDFRRMTWHLEGLRVALGVSGVTRSVAPHRLAAGKLGRSSVLDVRLPRQSRYVRLTKALLDRTVGALALVLATPLLLLLAAAVRLDSPGPALFRQTRVGQDGREFTLWKFRTMVPDAEERKADLVDENVDDDVLFKLRNDPRVTRFGVFLRTSSLDELPQLLNVARGEMSLVGPRPHVRAEVDAMDVGTRRRHAVAPGMTGLWQVNGRSDLSRDEAHELDTYYTDNWTLSGDLSILVRTVRAVLGHKGAY